MCESESKQVTGTHDSEAAGQGAHVLVQQQRQHAVDNECARRQRVQHEKQVACRLEEPRANIALVRLGIHVAQHEQHNRHNTDSRINSKINPVHLLRFDRLMIDRSPRQM